MKFKLIKKLFITRHLALVCLIGWFNQDTFRWRNEQTLFNHDEREKQNHKQRQLYKRWMRFDWIAIEFWQNMYLRCDDGEERCEHEHLVGRRLDEEWSKHRPKIWVITIKKSRSDGTRIELDRIQESNGNWMTLHECISGKQPNSFIIFTDFHILFFWFFNIGGLVLFNIAV